MADSIYRDEKINPPRRGRLPQPLANARKLARKGSLFEFEQIFYKQALALVDYEDDYVYEGSPFRFCPSYQSLSDEELRGYFAWRTKIRRGETVPAIAAFVFIYAYEIINNVGVASPLDGLNKLKELLAKPGFNKPILSVKIREWMRDYVVYYNLDESLYEPATWEQQGDEIDVVANILRKNQEEAIAAIKDIAPNWLKRSRFYVERREDLDAIIFQVIKKMTIHYARNCKKTFVEQFIGSSGWEHYWLFREAIFANPLERTEYKYKVTNGAEYICSYGSWTIKYLNISSRSARKLDKLLKTIDSVAREEWGDKHKILPEIKTKWIINLIREEVRARIDVKEAESKAEIKIDFSALAKIRDDAALTRDKLNEAELEVTDPVEKKQENSDDVVQEKIARESASLFSPAEERLARCLLYGGDLDWVEKEGGILSVLVDSANEKLYDILGDAPLDDTPAVIADYIDDLKELFRQ